MVTIHFYKMDVMKTLKELIGAIENLDEEIETLKQTLENRKNEVKYLLGAI